MAHKNILVVSGKPNNALLLMRLSDLGFNVSQESTSDQAVQKLFTSPCDAIVIDSDLADDHPGTDLVMALRINPSDDRVPQETRDKLKGLAGIPIIISDGEDKRSRWTEQFENVHLVDDLNAKTVTAVFAELNIST